MKNQSGFIPLWAFVLALALTVLAFNAYTSGGHDHCGHGSHDECIPPPPDPLPTTPPTVHNKKDIFTGKDFALAALTGCGFTSLYQGLANNRWRWPYQWCLGLGEDTPRKTTAADDRITPPPTQEFGIKVEVKK